MAAEKFETLQSKYNEASELIAEEERRGAQAGRR